MKATHRCEHCGGEYVARVRAKYPSRFCSRRCKASVCTRLGAAGLAAKMRDTFADRFWSRVLRGDGCWEWQGKARLRFGYGVVGLNGTQEVAHRVSYRMAYGEIPDGLVIAHRCDNPRCVRPDHLEAISQSQNLRDMWIRGRGRSAKIAANDVVTIRGALAQGAAPRKLAREFGVSAVQIGRIRSGKCWASVTVGA